MRLTSAQCWTGFTVASGSRPSMLQGGKGGAETQQFLVLLWSILCNGAASVLLTHVFLFSPSAGSLHELVLLRGARAGKRTLSPLFCGYHGYSRGWSAGKRFSRCLYQVRGFLLVSPSSQPFSRASPNLPEWKEANRKRVSLRSVSYFAC